MKKFAAIIFIGFMITACGGGNSHDTANKTDPYETETAKEDDNPSYDPARGEGKFKDVVVSEKLDAALASSGEKIFSVKCGSCHKVTNEKLVGPGWKGVTTRRTVNWILNFITNPDAMIDKDPELQAQLELCLVRMPNQNLADDDAKSLYEFMRKNDGVK